MEPNDGRGWVKPVSDDPEAAQMEPFVPARPARRSLLVGGLILTVVIAAAIAGAALWRGLDGDPFGSARSVPANMDYVVSFDALALSDSERLQSFVDAFGAPMFEAGLIEEQPDDLIRLIDSALDDETGLTLTDDILPWIGRSVSIAGTIPEIQEPLDSFYDFEPSFLLSADVRDQEAAQAFVDKLRVSLEDDGAPVTAAVIGGQEGYRIGDIDDVAAAALVLTDGAMLVGVESDVVAAMEARESGVSMAGDATFLETMTLLPSDQMVSFYVSARAFDSMARLGSIGLPEIAPAGEAPVVLASLGGSIGLVDEGLLMTYVVVGDDTSAELAGPDLAVLEVLPVETLGFISIAGAQAGSEPTFDNAALEALGFPAELFEDEFGIDLVTILEALSGDFTVAATETRDSFVSRIADVPVGIVMALGLNDPAPMADLMGIATEQLQLGGLSAIVDGAVTSFVDGGEEVVSYSLQDEYLIVGTGPDLVRDVTDGQEGGLLTTDIYRELDSALTGDGLVVFVDIGRIVRLIPMTSDEATVLEPLRGMGVGARSAGGATVVEALLLVDY